MKKWIKQSIGSSCLLCAGGGSWGQSRDWLWRVHRKWQITAGVSIVQSEVQTRVRVTRELPAADFTSAGRPIKQTGGGQWRENQQHEAAGAPCHVVWRKSRLHFHPHVGLLSVEELNLLGCSDCCCFFMARNGRQNLLLPSASCTPHG